MANKNMVSKKRMNAGGFMLIIVGVILFCFAAYELVIVSSSGGDNMMALLMCTVLLLMGVGLLIWGAVMQHKAKSAPTSEEIAEIRRQEAEQARQLLTEPEIKKEGAVFSVKGVRGRDLYVFEDKCIINVTAGIGSFITGNATDGEKTIYYSDVIGVQYKPSKATIGYLQLETASSQMNNLRDNHFNENSFTFDISTVSNERMAEVADYVKKRVEEVKRSGGVHVVQQSASGADELKKFKELLDAGVITEEEFAEKKKQILGI